jgi:hypothetical protein
MIWSHSGEIGKDTQFEAIIRKCERGRMLSSCDLVICVIYKSSCDFTKENATTGQNYKSNCDWSALSEARCEVFWTARS